VKHFDLSSFFLASVEEEISETEVVQKLKRAIFNLDYYKIESAHYSKAY